MAAKLSCMCLAAASLLLLEGADAFMLQAPSSAMLLRPAGCRSAAAGRPRAPCSRLVMQQSPFPTPEGNFEFPGIRGSDQLFANPILAAGDSLALLAFAAIGRGQHSSADGNVFTTAVPFLLAWFLLAPALGAYSPNTVASLKRAGLVCVPAWLASIPAGVAMRGLTQGYMPAVPFWIVSLVAIVGLMGTWRVAFCQYKLVTATVDDFVGQILSDDD